MRKPRTATASADTRVYGLYPDFGRLRAGVHNLKALHFSNDDISVLFAEAVLASSFLPLDPDCRSPEDESAAFIGGTLGGLTYLHPEGNGIISAALAGMGVPEGEADLYEGSLRRGQLLVCVRSSAKNSLESAIKAISLTGAERVIAAFSPCCGDAINPADCCELLLDEQLPASALAS